MSSIVNKTIHGVRWNFQSQLITQLVNFAVSILLMRLLLPTDFGQFAMVYVVVNFLQIFRDSNLSQALIQKVNIDELEKSSVFWYHLGVSIAIALLIAAMAHAFNRYYAQEHLEYIAYWLALDFALGAIGLVPNALLRMKLNFKALFYIQLIGLIGSTVAALGLAYAGWGLYSLVAKVLVWTAVTSIGTLLAAGWRPKFKCSTASLLSLSSFALPATGNSLLSYINRNVDDFFIGSVIGSSAMGFYNRAYALMLLPLGSFTSVLRGVLFPSWSNIQADAVKVKDMYLRTSGVIAFITFPAMILMAVLALPLVQICLGPQWVPMVTTIKILSIIGMFQSVGTMVGVIFMVYNRNKQLLKINLATTVIMCIAIIWTVYTFRTIEHTAAAYAIVSMIFLYPTFYLGGKIINASFYEMIAPILQPLLFGVIIGWLSWQVFPYFSEVNKIFGFIFSIVVPLALYLALAFFFKSKALTDLIQAIAQLKSSNG